jgi:hypothetical protein
MSVAAGVQIANGNLTGEAGRICKRISMDQASSVRCPEAFSRRWRAGPGLRARPTVAFANTPRAEMQASR